MNYKTINKKRVEKINPRFVLAAFFVIAAFAFCRVFFTAKIATIGDQIKTLETEKALLIQDIKLLSADIAQLASLGEIEKKATEEYRMVKYKGSIEYLGVLSHTSILARN